MKIVKFDKSTVKTIKFVILSCFFMSVFGMIGACADKAGKKAAAAMEEKKVEQKKVEDRVFTKIGGYSEAFSANYVDAFIVKYKNREFLVITSYTGSSQGGAGVAIKEITDTTNITDN